MSNNFEHKPLSQLCTLLNGLAFKPEDWSEYGHPIIRIQNLNGSSNFNFCNRSVPNEYKILPDTVLFSWSGNRGTSFGPYWWKGPHGVLNQHIFKVTAKSGIYPRWLYYGLDFARQKAEQEAHGGSGLVHVRRTDLLAYQIPTPPLPEQRRIAEILDTIDEAIQKTEALISKLKVMKQGLLHDLLTRGLDKNGKLRDPKAHPKQFKDSPLGTAAPRSWRVQKLQNFYDEPSVNGLYKTKKYYGHGPLMIHMPQMFRGLIIDTSDAARVEVNSAEIDRYGLRHGDLVFARRSLNLEGAGRCALVNNLTETTTFESSIIRVRIRQEELLPEFVNYFLNSAIGFRLRLPLIRQVAVSGVSSGDIASIPIPCPSISEQERIIKIIEAHVSRIRNEEQYREKLKLQKKGLMHDLLIGKVRVKT
jgi:type I restriction enzyme S subunit